MRIKTETAVGIFILIAITAFLYISFKIGYFRFDKLSYNSYSVYLTDASGLTKKSDVKISGIKIGWVDSIELSEDGTAVKLILMILKKYKFKSDSQVIIRQDGLLGFKFIDIIQGQSDKFLEGTTLQRGKIPASMEDLINSFNKIAKDIQESSEKVKHLLEVNKNNITDVVCDIHKIIKELKDHIPQATTEFNEIINKLNKDFLPKLTNNFDVVAKTISNGTFQFQEKIGELKFKADKFTKDFESTTESVKKTSEEIHNIAKKINQGDSFLSKLVNNPDEPKNNGIKQTVTNVYNCIQKFNNITLGLDNYHEFGFGIGPNHCNNYKTHLNFWINPTNYYFFLGGLTFSKYGYTSQRIVNLHPLNKCNDLLDQEFLDIKRKPNSFSFNLQVGAYYKNFALRAGIFESTPGISLDYLFPYHNDKFKWVSSFQVFDFTGKNHFPEHHKPHLKWINRLFYTPNFYLSFGLDDFATKNNLNAFIGFGLTFGDTYFR